MTDVTTHPPENAATPDSALDLLIVGAGMSGVDLAYHVTQNFPTWSWEIHDNHAEVGGTWHTVRYPGIRSDSDMATFNFPFQPWPHRGTLGQGPDIKRYITEAAQVAGVPGHLHLRSWIKNVDWCSEHAVYRVTALRTTGAIGGGEDAVDDSPNAAAPAAPGEGPQRVFYARRVHFAVGYFAHGRGHRPSFPGEEAFRGSIVHPQQWPEQMDYAGRRIAVIGSGATAISLIPALVDLGAQVTMVQRTPSYVAPLPEVDVISAVWKTLLPHRWALPVARLNHAARDELQYLIAQHLPSLFALALRLMQRRYLSAAAIDQHFTPSYRPWDQRVCKAPDGDIFRAMNKGAQVVTGSIDCFTPTGIRMTDGQEVPADVIVTATGMDLQAFGTGTVSVDGQIMDPAELVTYRGALVAGCPNFSFTLGYLNASWTLRADLVSRYLVRLWKLGEDVYVPVLPPGRSDRRIWEFESGYIQRGIAQFPTQGDAAPWRYEQNYLAELKEMRFGDVRRDMAFGREVTKHVGIDDYRKVKQMEIQSFGAKTPQPHTDLTGLPVPKFVGGGMYPMRVRVRPPSGSDVPRRVVVMVHGLSRSLEDWDDQVALWDDRDQLIAVDLPGFGRTPGLLQPSVAGFARRIWGAVDEVAEMQQNQGVSGGIHIVGNSLGGSIAMEMAIGRPASVASITMVDPAGFGSSMSVLLKLIALPGIGKVNAWATRLRPIYQPVEHVILRRRGAVTRHRIAVAGQVTKNPDRTDTYYRLVRLLCSPRGWRSQWQRQLSERFRAVNLQHEVPVSVVWGRGDKIVPFSHFRRSLEELAPKAAMVFDNCGHMPQLEYPQEFCDAVDRFQQEAEAFRCNGVTASTRGAQPMF
ncbi:alpha/beta fold hydrolase [Corynebacterium heidelbergense]|nr:alpha/beta fold hydrolase [Corynebacterium heidelbergense]